ncbi:hypothetical protein D3C76_1800630 [compost metagenome]
MKNDTEIMHDIAHSYFKLKDYEQAIEWAGKILEIEPAHCYANKLLHTVKILMNREMGE